MHGVTRTQNSFKMNVFRVKISKIFPARPNHGGPRGAELKPLFAGSYYTLTVDRAGWSTWSFVGMHYGPSVIV